MEASAAPEEQRFDFGLVDTPDKAAAAKVRSGARRGRAEVSSADASVAASSDPAAQALVRRVEEVAAVAHGERPPGVPARTSGVARLGVKANPHSATATGAAPREGSSAPADPGVGADVAGDPVESLSVAEFYERVKRALARAFADEVWVTGEIRGFREVRGHRYLELADEGAEIVGRSAAQQLEVVCWSRDWPPVAAALAGAGVNLEVGRVVRVRGRVSVWEGGSKLRFTLTALDIEALLGGIAAARHRLLQSLEREGLLDANNRLRVPIVPLRIGLVTSQGSEAHRDFVGQLTRSGFAFVVHLEPSLVQGPEAPRQIAAALGRLVGFAPDLAVMVRGGGARGDLAAFDSEEVARAIAGATFPVWTGIGHTGDRSVADEVAQRALITPTACGEAVVAVVYDYWSSILQRGSTLSGLARARLDTAAQKLHGAAQSVTRGGAHQLDRRVEELRSARSFAARAICARFEREGAGLARDAAGLALATRRALGNAEKSGDQYRQVLRAYDPGRQLERGWSLARDGAGRLVRSAAQLGVGDEMTTHFVDGAVASRVTFVGDGRNHASSANDRSSDDGE